MLNALKAWLLLRWWTEPPAATVPQPSFTIWKASLESSTNLRVSPKGHVKQSRAYIPLSVRFFRMTWIVRISRIRGFGIHSNGELALEEGAAVFLLRGREFHLLDSENRKGSGDPGVTRRWEQILGKAGRKKDINFQRQPKDSRR